MIRWFVALACICAPLTSQASRVVEVEDYFSKKASGFVKMRYPSRPFTVQVKVLSGESNDRRMVTKDAKNVVSLPYLEFSGDTSEDIWSRTDIPLGTLISYVKSISVNVEIDASFSGNEKEDFKQQLFKYLKLSSAYDQVEVRKMDWVKSPEVQRNRWVLLAAVGFPLFLALFLLVISRVSVRQLVRGLSEPLAAIGKNTESMATPSMAPGALSSVVGTAESGRAGTSDRPSVSNESFQDLLEKNKKFFERPNGELMHFLEHWGQKYPHSMGAILAELDPQTVRSLVAWGYGDWWHTAVTQPSGVDGQVLGILSEMSILKLRETLGNQNSIRSADALNLELALSRLDVKVLGQVFKGYSLEELKPAFALLPRGNMINCAKYMFPGQWATLIDGSVTQREGDSGLFKKLYKSALEMVPLRGDKDIEAMFLEADLVSYLDQAKTSDEREVYRVLGDESRIKTHRFPFYQVFLAEASVLERLSFNLPLQVWALALSDCDVEERKKVYDSFTDRQIYSVKQLIAQIENDSLPKERKIQSKRMIRDACASLVKSSSVVEDRETYAKVA